MCEQAREVLSAQLDDEASEEEIDVAQSHLARCRGCAAWLIQVSLVSRSLRVRSAESVPDLASAVLATANVQSRRRRGWARYALAVVALTELAGALPGLLGIQGTGSIHDGRHLGSFGSAVAVGLLYVAWRPSRAFGILPIVTALAATMLVAATVDVAAGRASGLGEAHHTVELAGLWLVWLLAGHPLPRRLRSGRAAHSRPLVTS